ncbi:uncharacterized protein DUF397 [Haloactinospora alba]|uniref:Uncharacterized protein DUF397 n=1 Tax=Haloactinospora alba TaxID=405555 RepID=A0A543NM95_9ACTN|nr:DUF397 domain-containing protein [Haloactinospora alba]TQN32939.1 uncharacterized protein DUF397 [Haloactinospora alba]
MHSIPNNLWHVSTYSTSNNCVEVASQPEISAVRDTKNREHGNLLFSSREWRAFVEAVRNEEV